MQREIVSHLFVSFSIPHIEASSRQKDSIETKLVSLILYIALPFAKVLLVRMIVFVHELGGDTKPTKNLDGELPKVRVPPKN